MERTWGRYMVLQQPHLFGLSSMLSYLEEKQGQMGENE